MNNKSIDIGNKKIYKSFKIKDIKSKELKILERKQSKRILKSKNIHKKLGKNFYKTQIKVKKINKKIKNRRNYSKNKIFFKNRYSLDVYNRKSIINDFPLLFTLF